MPAPQVTVIGGMRLRRELRRAGVDLQMLRAANMRAAQVASGVAKGLAPVGSSGRLAASVRPGATQAAGILRAGGARVPYAGVQEWGWPARNITGTHYLTSGAQRSEPQWVAIYQRELERVLDSVAGGP